MFTNIINLFILTYNTENNKQVVVSAEENKYKIINIKVSDKHDSIEAALQELLESYVNIGFGWIKTVLVETKKQQKEMKQYITKSFLLFATFMVLLILILLLNGTLTKFHIDSSILHFANAFFFILSLLSFLLQSRSLQNKNPNVFIRSIMGGMMLKMFATVIAVFIYVSINDGVFNKKGLFISLFFYLIYLAIEVKVIMQLNSSKNA
jgi:hypothetical protein